MLLDGGTPDQQGRKAWSAQGHRLGGWFASTLLAASLGLVACGGGSAVSAVPPHSGGHPGAPFGRSSGPAPRSDTGIVLASPMGYEWTDDGALLVEVWIFNGNRLPMRVDCAVSISSGGELVARGEFAAIDGVISPRTTHVTRLSFAPTAVGRRFANLDSVNEEHSCHSTSV
jgi:hypothetical protein